MQTEYWQGSDGDAYTQRQLLSMTSRSYMFRNILDICDGFHSIIEFGANDGSNLRAIHDISPFMGMGGVEVNLEAFEKLKTIAHQSFHGSMLDDLNVGVWDMSMTRGVLIHISPDSLNKAYEALYNASRKYICITEYYSPTPRMIPYRGRDNLLWARDFAGEMMDLYPLKLVDYFFTYHRDHLYPQDDVTTFIMERK